MAIVSTGIGSGLNIESLVTQLMQAESTPLTQLQAKETSYKSKLSAFGTLKSAISSFQTAVKSVTGTSLAALTAASSDETIMKASTPAGGGATAGTYAIEVSKLATSDKLSSAGVDPTKIFSPANSSMTISVGSGNPVNIPLDDFSMSGLASAINGADAGVTATVINDGTMNHLVVTAKDTGSANTVKIAATGSVAQFDNTDPMTTTMSWQQKAGDAQFTVDGMPVVKSSNTVTDAIKGVTLNLAKTNVGAPVNVTVAKDSDTIKKNVQGLIDAYNKIASTVGNLTSYNTSTKTGAVLNGDSSARGILSQLRSELGKATSDAGDLKNLSDIGIVFQRDGTLMLEKPDKLQKAIDSNFDNLSKLFSSTSGVGTRLTALTTDMLGSKGVIQTRTDGINDTLKRMSDQESTIQDRLTQTEARYRKQFNALDTAMANMKSTSNYLATQLASLSSSY
ncbi:flagellar filament capping protein FliD [Massilia sp. 2TAF26]|uniref:flagellar filament capping protein FliD n=1 Tax=Massilia sp. 2TAF26 TaxID=3233012 RepID=UPI003F94A8B5